MINSCINKYIKERPKLLVCEVLIKKLEHPFLNHDSFIDCREVCPLSENELNDYVGNLDSQTIQHTMESVRNCPVLPRKYKNYIL